MAASACCQGCASIFLTSELEDAGPRPRERMRLHPPSVPRSVPSPVTTESRVSTTDCGIDIFVLELNKEHLSRLSLRPNLLKMSSVTVRVVRSLAYRNVKSLVIKDIDLGSTTVGQLEKIICERRPPL